MKNYLFNINEIRVEISFKNYDQLISLLAFYERNNISKINIPCKSNLNSDLLLNAIKISRNEFPHLDLIPHFSIQHEFRRNKFITIQKFINFIKVVNSLGCNEVLLISGSQKKLSLDSVSALSFINSYSEKIDKKCFIGVAFNPYLPDSLFNEEIVRLKSKLTTGFVDSIWIQFGTDYDLLEKNIKLLKNIINIFFINGYINPSIRLYGSILIPYKQFLARFRFRPWKGVYCSDTFLNSAKSANEVIVKLLDIYKKNDIIPIIETNTSNDKRLSELHNFINF